MPPASQPVLSESSRGRPAQVTDGLSTALEQMIQEGALGDDHRLPPERELAQRLGVSRTSLREALHELELKGLIDRRPGRGTVVVAGRGDSLLGHMETAERGLREVMDLRGAIEPPIAARAAQRATADDLDVLRELLERMRAATTVARAAQLDIEFHDAIARATHNPLLIKLMRFASEEIDVGRRRRAHSRRRRERTIAAHDEIVARISAHDAEGAAAAMARHIAEVNEEIGRADDA
ncbi:MAG: GntR family transcriptional regulator, transcriptional repressor for pyruvate dehydrogenase complex [Solirubrobacteraceae bacterium]|jgi:GntR family transcriptional repressor for pyruvate dehydrogenase complex|nr:GntR family transcriptional regulator, transcriptional repressor for pyruvate dehydrogenase complex [Solirubrobacteraceae bacterium]MEA2276156.1 GntR family transcriptional regulator, transcriptional repressor for pyruvate dehydrogenase complex [Solirubrobacteraceae bacterium]MEA2360411.1 GntR family transcriptional regulator, transcriptional repressor for pyruvate dehydrogenase complex [Solirubrobacteraceae bacterium]MEA2393499.1 GntR family transcriptional regulator, transcriptional repress